MTAPTAVTLHVEERDPKKRYELVDENDRAVLVIERERSTAAKWGFGSSRLRYAFPDGSTIGSTHGSDFEFEGVPWTKFKDSLSAGTKKSWYNSRCTSSTSCLR